MTAKIFNVSNHGAGKRDLYPFPESSTVAVGDRELYNGLTITGFCDLTKTASATILHYNKTAKMAFFNHAKRHHKRVRLQCLWVSIKNYKCGKLYRFLLYREVGFPEPLFKAIPVNDSL